MFKCWTIIFSFVSMYTWDVDDVVYVWWDRNVYTDIIWNGIIYFCRCVLHQIIILLRLYFMLNVRSRSCAEIETVRLCKDRECVNVVFAWSSRGIVTVWWACQAPLMIICLQTLCWAFRNSPASHDLSADARHQTNTLTNKLWFYHLTLKFERTVPRMRGSLRLP